MVRYKQEDIQRRIKEIIPKDFLFLFFEKSINENNIMEFGKLLDLEMVNNKYLFDLILALLYKEVISIENIENIISDIDIEVLEKAVVLEYGLFEIPDGLMGTAIDDNYEIKFIRDYVPRIYYGINDKISYKDFENISNELQRIYEIVEESFN
jgi:hypothetical protein